MHRCCALVGLAGVVGVLVVAVPDAGFAGSGVRPASVVERADPLRLTAPAASVRPFGEGRAAREARRPRRSWSRTAAGGALAAAAFFVPLGREHCVVLPDFSGGAAEACTLRLAPARVAAALGMVAAGVALSTVFSTVRSPSTRVVVAPRRLSVTHAVGF